CGNSAGAWKIGLPSANEIRSGKELKAGIVLFSDENEIRDFHWDVFKDADFLAVISPYLPNPIPENVHVIIPKPLCMEEDGTYTSLDGMKDCYKNRVLIPPEGVKDTWLTLVKLMERMGLKMDFKIPDGVRKQAKKEIKKQVAGRV
ncbi:MAG: hypothetical protein MUP22_05030, partial [Desulfobacterales bacterium]|nr:hypothetical protein [Desulfobacterales bacterium]